MAGRQVRIAVMMLCCAATRGASAQPPPSTAGRLVARSSLWCLEVVQGRIQLSEPRLGQAAEMKESSADGGAQEILSFSAIDADSAALQYEYRDQDEHWLLEIEHTRQLLLQRHSRGGACRVKYRQPATGPVSLILEQDDHTQQIVAADFWRLMLADPAACREHLLPVLSALRPDWQLAGGAQRLEEALLAAAADQPPPGGPQVAILIAQLGDSDFQRRQAADRQLREMGQRMVGHLERLDLSGLNAEQRSRVRQIQRRQRVPLPDTPQRVAAWLIDDPATWVSLLEREDSQRRLTAAAELARLLGRPVDFDPLAADVQRQRQLAALKGELGLGEPLLIGGVPPATTRR